MASNQTPKAPEFDSKLPFMLYGTAFKEEKTAELTQMAITHGFTGLDTANYPTAYNEPMAGDAIAASLQSGIRRSALFVCPY